jgi:hypothetical protein
LQICSKRGLIDNGAYVRSNAPEIFAGSKLALVEDFAPAPVDSARIVAAFYSLPDLKVVDEFLHASLTRSVTGPVEVFDVLICKSMEDVDRLIPGITPVYQTPMVGIWKNGELVRKGSNVENCREILAQRLRDWPPILTTDR